MSAQKSTTRFNPKRDLPYLAALAQTSQFSLAGSILLGNRGWFFGGLLGLLISVTMAYATSQYTEIAKERRKVALWLVVGLGIFSPLIIGTSMFLDLPQNINPIWRGIVGAVWGILPDASVALVGFVAGKGLVKREESSDKNTQETPKSNQQRPKKPKKVAKQHVTDDQLIAELKSNPAATDDELAQLFKVSRQAINKRRHKLTPAQLGF